MPALPVPQLCALIAWKLTEAVQWRARARDALCGLLNLRGPAPPHILEALIADAAPLGVELAEIPILQACIRDARKWQRSADDVLRQANASAAAATSAELLHFEDAAGAGPEADYVSVPGRVTQPLSDVKGGPEGPSSAAAPAQLPASKLTARAAAPVEGEGAAAAAAVPAAGRAVTRKRMRSGSPTVEPVAQDADAAPAAADGDGAELFDDDADQPSGEAKKAHHHRSHGSSKTLGGAALAFSSRFSALVAAADTDPPVSLDEVRVCLRESLAIPVGLNPQLADLKSRVTRCADLAAAILQHLPNASFPGHSARPCGSRLQQAYGVSEGVLGTAGGPDTDVL